MIVQLTDAEYAEATEIGRKRYTEGRKLRNAHRMPGDYDTEALAIHSAAAELAVAKALGVEWTERDTHVRGGPDVGTRTQVRTNHPSKPWNNSLLLRQRDLDLYGNVPFVVAVGHAGFFEITGWECSGRVVQQHEPSTFGNPDRPPCWLVRPRDLQPIETLRNP